jgi:hypothetical protein
MLLTRCGIMSAAVIGVLTLLPLPALAGASPVSTPDAGAVPAAVQSVRGRGPLGGPAHVTGGRFLATGFARPAWLTLRILGASFRAQPANSAALQRTEGRRVLEFPVGEQAAGLFVRVSGDIEFERADIGFPDGSLQSVDAFGERRGSGIYRLVNFDEGRAVDWVRIVLRARSRNARVDLLIGR